MLRSSSASVVYWPGGAEGVAGEVGEFEDQFAGAVGVGAHERGDGVQRVVDEVRTDLGPQGEDFGSVEAGARRVEFGQFDLAGRVAGDLADRAEHAGAWCARRDHDQHTEHLTAFLQQRLGDDL